MSNRRRRRRSRVEIEALVDRFERSGTTQAEFAREQWVSVSTVQGWLRRVRESRASRSPGWVEVNVAAGAELVGGDIDARPAAEGTGTGRHVFRVEFGERLRVAIASGFEEDELRSVLRILNQEVVSC